MDTAFAPGSMVLLTLIAPREKFWGLLLALGPAGISVCGVDLNSFDETVHLLRTGEAVPTKVFFPMQRVERMEADLAGPGLPSIAERFRAITGHEASELLATL